MENAVKNDASMYERNVVHIDVKSVLENKLPSLKGRIPSFVISYLKKIVHEDEVNEVFSTYGHLRGVDFADEILEKHFRVKIKVVGAEKLPDSSRQIFACNHPIGSIDGIAVISVLGRRYPNLKIPVNDILMHIENLSDFFIPVNKIQGKGQSRSVSTSLNEVCASDDALFFFPSGQCSRMQPDGTIRDNEWKKTFISKAREYGRDIIPVHFDGRLSDFFYKLSYYRMKFGIKTNIEMLYLADELFKQKDKTYTVVFGNPISCRTLDSSKCDKEWAREIQNISYGLTSREN